MNKINKQKINFTQITNELLNDHNISSTAKGIYCYMYSKPDEWEFTIKKMQSQLKEGYDAISRALKELKENGWIVYEKQKNGKSIYNLVWEKENPKSENPIKAQPSQKRKTPLWENPTMGKSDCINNKEELIILEEEKKEKRKNWIPQKETIEFIENQYGLKENLLMEEVRNFKRFVITKNKNYEDMDTSFIIHVKNGMKKGLIERGNYEY